MHCVTKGCLSLTVIFTAATRTQAQHQFLLTDRDLDAAMRVRDLNANGSIDAGEVFTFFSGANAAGTLGPMNPTCMAVSLCRVVAMGDQINRNVYWISDVNNDGDAQDQPESVVYADATNAALISFAFPTGAAFDSQCRMHIANAGNTFGLDGIYRLQDLNGDGDAQDQVGGVNEVTEFVGQPLMGSVNSALWGPQEIFFDPDDVCYMRNSVTNQHSIWRFEDGNGNGRADDAGESTLFFGAGNLSGITLTAGFAMEQDRFQPGAMYTIQIATGGLDQLIRMQDLTGDDDAQDALEAHTVWTEVVITFSAIDAVSLPNGDVLLTEGGSGRVHRLHDLTNDRDFLDAGEITLYHDNASAILLDIRQIDVLRRKGDTDGNGVVNVVDLLMVIGGWGGPGSACRPPDIDCSGTTNVEDLLAVIGNWG